MADNGQTERGAKQRLDRWLFFSRAVKSRTLAQKLIESGAVRVNSERTLATDARVGAGDVLTMSLGRHLKVWRILETGERRGPATEAAGLYEDLSPPPLPGEGFGEHEPGSKDHGDADRRQEDED